MDTATSSILTAFTGIMHTATRFDLNLYIVVIFLELFWVYYDFILTHISYNLLGGYSHL